MWLILNSYCFAFQIRNSELHFKLETLNLSQIFMISFLHGYIQIFRIRLVYISIAHACVRVPILCHAC